MTIREAVPADHETLVALGRRSVRVTHTFLTEAAIQERLPLVWWQALPVFALWALEDAGTPVGFAGLDGPKLEARFLDPAHLGRGGGRRLVEHARRLKGPLQVDVNEQNPALGFRVVGRAEVDGGGRPFPLLHIRERP